MELSREEDAVRRQIRLRRLQHGLSQRELAEKGRAQGLIWNREAVKNLESGIRRIRVHELVSLVTLLGGQLNDYLVAPEPYDEERLRRDIWVEARLDAWDTRRRA